MKVNIKWGKELYKDVEVDMEQPPEMFKMQLYSLTGVPTERQKVMGKGGMLKDDAWGKVTFKEGSTVIMMGSAESAPAAPKEEVKFLEDLPEDEQVAAETKEYGSGLENLGNTCYMNSCLQCMYAVPELAEALSNANNDGMNGRLAGQGRALLQRMAQGHTIAPWEFLTALRAVAPQFDEMGRQVTKNGRVHAQQDAEECWGALITAFRAATRHGGADPVHDLFALDTHATLTCAETGETATEATSAINLKCNITADVNHLADGLKLALVEDREKHSAQLERLAPWTGAARVARLPPYLTVQVMRFFYKVEAQQRAKIFRAVSFPLQLDLFELCTEELKAQLKGPRGAFHAHEEAQKGPGAAAATEAQGGAAASTSGGGGGDAEMTEAEDGDAEKGVDYAGRLTGRYDLIAVLTHKGRTLDSGHYVAWVKQGGEDAWVQFDDDKLVPRKGEDIIALKGGGDWHTAYLMLWRAQRVPAAAATAAA